LFDQPSASTQEASGRIAKRNAGNAFGQENVWGESSGTQEVGGLMIARMLGFNMPGLNPPYVPYNTGGVYNDNVDWWSQDPTAQGSAAGSHLPLPETAHGNDDPRSSARSAGAQPQLTYSHTSNPAWMNPNGHFPENYNHYPGMPGGANRYETQFK
jgi:hypothetical protein